LQKRVLPGVKGSAWEEPPAYGVRKRTKPKKRVKNLGRPDTAIPSGKTGPSKVGNPTKRSGKIEKKRSKQPRGEKVTRKMRVSGKTYNQKKRVVNEKGKKLRNPL